MVGRVERRAERELLEVVAAGSCARGFFRACESGEEQADQYRDDRNDHE